MKKKIHFGWFAGNGYGPLGWDSPHASHGYDWRQPELFQKMAAICERGRFDYVLFADQVGIPIVYEGKNDTYVKYGSEIYQDTTMLAAMVGAATQHIGIGTTVSTGLMPPYLLARQVSSLDHLTKGRIAWNVVTTANIAGYLNVGIDELPEHNARYDQADEYLDLCSQLWSSWEPDAVLMDRKTGIFGDPSKVHPIHFQGKHFKCRGPLAVAPSPQGRPAIIQAGASERGQEFAARWADAVIVGKNSESEMKEFHDDLKGRMAKYGRNPEELKIFFNIHPVVGETEEIAQLKNKHKEAPEEVAVPAGLATLSQRLGIDVSQFKLDEPLPDMTGKKIPGTRTAFSQFFSGRGPTLRQRAIDAHSKSERNPILGNPEQVADKLESIMEAVGGDGYNITSDSYNHAYMLEFVNSVIPILQERDLVRKEYTGQTLREHLMEV